MDRDKGKESQAPCRLLPVLLDLSDKHVCVIGDAPEAERYARFLAACTRHLSVLCEEASEELQAMASLASRIMFHMANSFYKPLRDIVISIYNTFKNATLKDLVIL